MGAEPVDWHTALAYALTGERIGVPPARTPDVHRLLGDLADLGWDAERLARCARRLPVPAAWVAQLGAARFVAVEAELRRGLAAGARTVRPARRKLDPEERRLVAERPPHWG